MHCITIRSSSCRHLSIMSFPECHKRVSHGTEWSLQLRGMPLFTATNNMKHDSSDAMDHYGCSKFLDDLQFSFTCVIGSCPHHLLESKCNRSTTIVGTQKRHHLLLRTVLKELQCLEIQLTFKGFGTQHCLD